MWRVEEKARCVFKKDGKNMTDGAGRPKESFLVAASESHFKVNKLHNVVYT